MTVDRKKQTLMHQDFFDRCKRALDNEFYMEAILMEYAAIEARLEVLMGVLGLPCNKFQDDSKRKSIQISHRINCANRLRRNSPLFDGTKLEKKYFEKVGKWIDKRNEYIHGLYKNELRYTTRIKDAKEFAEKGMEYCRLLYNEVNRLKRLRKNHPELFYGAASCASAKCTMNKNREDP